MSNVDLEWREGLGQQVRALTGWDMWDDMAHELFRDTLSSFGGEVPAKRVAIAMLRLAAHRLETWDDE